MLAPGSVEPRAIVTAPIAKPVFTVWLAPVIGREPVTFAEVLTPTKLRLATCPARVELSDTALPAIVIVREAPAPTINPPVSVAWCWEFKVLSTPICAPLSSSIAMESNDASLARPVRSTTKEFTVMLPSADAVSFTFVKGTRTAFCGNSVAETCSSAGPTVKVTPAVGVTTGVGAVGVVTSAAGVDGVAGVEGVEGVEGVATGAAPNNSFNFARVNEPTYPVPLESPIGASTLDAYLFWNLITALFVIGPKAIVSLPGEPAPDAAS